MKRLSLLRTIVRRTLVLFACAVVVATGTVIAPILLMLWQDLRFAQARGPTGTEPVSYQQLSFFFGSPEPTLVLLPLLALGLCLLTALIWSLLGPSLKQKGGTGRPSFRDGG